MSSFRQNVRDELARMTQELASLRAEHGTKPKEQPAFWTSPMWVALVGAAVTIVTGFWQLHANREVDKQKIEANRQAEKDKLEASREMERERLRSSLIQEASKSGNHDTTLKNLRFLLSVKLIDDPEGAIGKLKAEDAPSFAPPAAEPLRAEELIQRFGDPKIQTSGPNQPFGTPDGEWVKTNLITVELPQLVGMENFPSSGSIRFHKSAAEPLKAVLADIEKAGLLDRIKSFDGGWVPRAGPGSTKYSAHAFGIAIDLNGRFNMLGRPPIEKGKPGSVVELVPFFEKHGFYWGGHFKRPEPAHFQYGVKSTSSTFTPSATSLPLGAD